MYFPSSVVTTVVSLSPGSRHALGLRIRNPPAAFTVDIRNRLSSINKNSTASSSSSSSSSWNRRATSGGTSCSRRINSASSSSPSGEGHTCVVSAALSFLEGKNKVLGCLNAADYAAVDPIIGASIGAHMRHSLDHFARCLTCAALPPAPGTGGRSLQNNSVDNDGVGNNNEYDSRTRSKPQQFDNDRRIIRYDVRVRGGTVETDPAEAAKVIASLLEHLAGLPRGEAGSATLRKTRVAPAFMLGGEGGKEHEFESNLERELWFCCHHGIHHDAMIQLVLKRMEAQGGGSSALSEAGKDFGVAPSTVDFQQQQHHHHHHHQKNADKENK